MADNVTLDAGAGGDTIAADDVGGVKYQVVKLAVGADGAASLVANANPIPVADAGGSLTVDNAALSVTGGGVEATALRVTLASDSTGVVSVDDNGASLTVDNAGLTELAAAINASSQLDVNIAASGATVPISHSALTELAAAINASSQLDVNVAAGGVSGVVEDAAAAGGEEGIMMLAVRRDVASSGVSADGDFAALSVTSDGSLRVSGSAGTTQYAEDAAHASGDSVCVMGAVRRDTVAVGSGTDGDYSTVNVNASGRVYTTATIDAALPAGTNAIGKLAANSGVDIGDVDVTSIAAGDNNIGNVDIVTMPNVTLAAGTNTNEVVGDAAHDAAAAGNPLLIGGYASAAAPTDVSADADAVRLWALRNGSQVVNLAFGGTLVTATTVQETVGDVADDAATAGNPVLIGGVAVETDGTDPTTVSAEGDAAYLRTDRARRLLVSQHHPRGWWVSADYGSAQTNTSIKAAPGASLSLYVTDIVISNGATAGNITLLDGSGGTVVFEHYPAINGGIAISVKQPIRLTANTALCITSTTVTTHSVNIGGYTAP